jgi:hypothetical protein
METSTNRSEPPRLNVQLREDQFDALRQLLPHGHRKHVFQAIVDDLIALLRAAPDREKAIAFVIARMMNIPSMTFDRSK